MIDTNDISPVAVKMELTVVYATHLSQFADAVRNELAAAVGHASPVVTAVDGMEALYAFMQSEDAAFSDELAHALGRAAFLVATYDFHGKASRALGIYNAARRALGEDVAGEDPAVDAKFTPATSTVPTPSAA